MIIKSLNKIKRYISFLLMAMFLSASLIPFLGVEEAEAASVQQKLNNVFQGYGHYSLNATGVSAVEWTQRQGSPITYNEMAHVDKNNECSATKYYVYHNTNKNYLLPNSSSSYMNKVSNYPSYTTIKKAYLVISSSIYGGSYNNTDGGESTRQDAFKSMISDVKLKTPSGSIYTISNNSTWSSISGVDYNHQKRGEYTMYADVTNIIKNQSSYYGMYTCYNVPYSPSQDTDGDTYASWRLIFIEENPYDEFRYCTLNIGGKGVSHPGLSVTTETVYNTFTAFKNPSISTKKSGTVTGQVLLGVDGSDAEGAANRNVLAYSNTLNTEGIPSSYYSTLNREGTSETMTVIKQSNLNNAISSGIVKYCSFSNTTWRTKAYPFTRTTTIFGQRPSYNVTNSGGRNARPFTHINSTSITPTGADTLLDNFSNLGMNIANNAHSVDFLLGVNAVALYMPCIGFALDVDFPEYASVSSYSNAISSVDGKNYICNKVRISANKLPGTETKYTGIGQNIKITINLGNNVLDNNMSLYCAADTGQNVFNLNNQIGVFWKAGSTDAGHNTNVSSPTATYDANKNEITLVFPKVADDDKRLYLTANSYNYDYIDLKIVAPYSAGEIKTVKKVEGIIIAQDAPTTLLATVRKAWSISNAYSLTLATSTGVASTTGGGNAFLSGSNVKINSTMTDGYSFAGWYKGTTLVSSSQSYTYKMPAENVTLTAKGKLIQFKVSFDDNIPNGDIPSVNPDKTVIYNSDMPEIEVPVRQYTVTFDFNGNGQPNQKLTAKYIFNGYYLGDTKYYNSDGTSAKKWDKTTNETLTAKWTSSAVKTPIPTRTGYQFMGWSTSKSGTGEITGDYTPTQDITLYAIWQDNIKPSGTIVANPSDWTNGNVIITATGEDNGSGLKKLEILNEKGTVVASTINRTLSYTDTTEGIEQYTARITDNAGNQYTVSTTDYIDRVRPVPDITIDGEAEAIYDDNANSTIQSVVIGWVNRDVTINVKASDNSSGIQSIVMYDHYNNVIESNPSGFKHTFTTEEVGHYTIIVKDVAGNTKTINLTVMIDKTAPVIIGDEEVRDANFGLIEHQATDSLSGIKSFKLYYYDTMQEVTEEDGLEYRAGNVIYFKSIYTYNLYWKLIAEDQAGNLTEMKVHTPFNFKIAVEADNLRTETDNFLIGADAQLKITLWGYVDTVEVRFENILENAAEKEEYTLDRLIESGNAFVREPLKNDYMEYTFKLPEGVDPGKYRIWVYGYRDGWKRTEYVDINLITYEQLCKEQVHKFKRVIKSPTWRKVDEYIIGD